MRRAGLLPGAPQAKPVFASFDLSAAFPSLGRVWFFAALGHFGIPAGLMNLFRALYYAPNSCTKTDGVRHTMFAIESGVAQGCPASGSAWAIAIDPLTRHLAKFVEHRDGTPNLDAGYIAACADD
eukprot:2963366-Pyramimonas_sp.AAC.1